MLQEKAGLAKEGLLQNEIFRIFSATEKGFLAEKENAVSIIKRLTKIYDREEDNAETVFC